MIRVYLFLVLNNILLFGWIIVYLVIYILGVLWLGMLIGWDKPILKLGVMPFLLAEFFKITLLTSI